MHADPLRDIFSAFWKLHQTCVCVMHVFQSGCGCCLGPPTSGWPPTWRGPTWCATTASETAPRTPQLRGTSLLSPSSWLSSSLSNWECSKGFSGSLWGCRTRPTSRSSTWAAATTGMSWRKPLQLATFLGRWSRSREDLLKWPYLSTFGMTLMRPYLAYVRTKYYSAYTCVLGWFEKVLLGKMMLEIFRFYLNPVFVKTTFYLHF